MDTVTAVDLPSLVQQWIDTPGPTKVLLGAELVMHPYWSTRKNDMLDTNRATTDAACHTAINECVDYEVASQSEPNHYALASQDDSGDYAAIEADYQTASNAVTNEESTSAVFNNYTLASATNAAANEESTSAVFNNYTLASQELEGALPDGIDL